MCSYLQKIKISGQGIYTYTNKLKLSNSEFPSTFLNISDTISNIPSIHKTLTSVFDFVLKDILTWQCFMSLSKQEKIIIRLLVEGKSNEEIGELLFVSPNTIKTHRRNIYRKMDIHKINDLAKIAIALEFPI